MLVVLVALLPTLSAYTVFISGTTDIVLFLFYTYHILWEKPAGAVLTSPTP